MVTRSFFSELGPDGGSFSDRVAATASSLTVSQSKVVRYFERNATLALASSAEDLAKVLGVSTASVVRAAQALGYDGLTALKHGLATEVSEKGVAPERVLDRRLRTGKPGFDRFREMLVDMSDSIIELGDTVDPEAWEAAVSTLCGAHRVFAYGVEEAGHVIETLVHYLRTFGVDASSCTSTGTAFAPFATMASQADCIVLCCPLRVFPEIQALLEVSEASSIRCIVLTEVVDPDFVSGCSTVLTCPSTVLTDGSNVIAPMALVFALTQQLAAATAPASMAAYDRMLQMRSMAGRGAR
ncbi:hypothetical protein NQ036_10895 [Brevibacterium sp. 91QC2O2]|uniref:MurR/RpiR family transcriptional regulator n=1 Tax=Brevibacterium sp. 91QC2O2 TaxID=2968458 RepID=UPI00211B9A1B|nr:hypothetical protein [Brevibacterium sp. 91QC2O2]MCQ9368743.1 hypothetical protein [Brevibacterium sp. 91QC2O2]